MLARAKAGASALALAVAVAPADFQFRPGQDFRDAGHRLFDERSQYTLSIGALATAGSATLDYPAQAYMNHQRRIGDLDKLGNDVLGTGIPGALLALGIAGYGWAERDLRSVHSGIAQLEALAVTGIATLIMKVSIARTRPDQSDDESFPSGHTSTMFASAGAIGEIYGWEWGVPVYALAALTGAARLSENKHWLSDVFGGAVLGLYVSHAFVASHEEQGAFPKDLALWFEPAGDGGVVRTAWDF